MECPWEHLWVKGAAGSVTKVQFSPVQGSYSLNPELDSGSSSQKIVNLNLNPTEPDFGSSSGL